MHAILIGLHYSEVLQVDSKNDIEESKRWFIAIAVMLVTVMEVLDMTIVNVALPAMTGSLSATTDQITWVLTSYVVSAAIMMPLTGFLINRIGSKKLLLLNIVGFLLSSMLCGMATSLTMMVLFRIMQGVFGAALVPLSQYILRNTFPPDQIMKAMAIWGVGIMTAPVLGPTIGGYITEIANWRWIFYINIPVCALAFFMCLRLIKETEIKIIKIDWLGILLLALGIGSLQIFLDRGNTVDWFDAASIRWLFMMTISALAIFIYRGMKINNNIINLHLFLDRNFSLGCALLALFCAGMLGILTLQPLLMENLMNYPPDLAGVVMAPRGIASAVAMACVPLLVKNIDTRFIIAIGIILCGIGTYAMTLLNLEISVMPFILLGIVQGLGMGLFFVPISSITFATLQRSDYAEATGLFSFWRSLGVSIGISLLSTLITREGQINWNTLNNNIQNFNPNLQYWLTQHHGQLNNSITLQQLTEQVSQQANAIAFLDAFYAVTIGFFLMVPLVFLFKKPASGNSSGLGHL
jgi:DHA2 family multidrug resistance protein